MFRVTVAAVVWAAGAVLVAAAADHTTDTLDAVKKAVADGKAVLVDVREADEWKDGHLADAKHLALSDLKAGVPADKLKKTLPDGKVVYLHCASGKRCLKAADLLKDQGYDVRPLKAGFEDLARAGFPKAK
ncbi:MAG: rhodanese-like domain-containing protein [Gemmataceae bacterium]|nr:rhodanese-like domain-containing protein [Gemmataceae bacterium]